MTEQFDVIVVGAGAAGMMSAIEAGKRGRKVLLVDHAKKIGEKIRISGGGRCNFTNIHTHPSKFISNNPKFVISALKQYTQNNFIDLIKKHNIKFHEKKLGQLFCDESAQQIIDMLLLECEMANVVLKKDTIIDDIDKQENKYFVKSQPKRMTIVNQFKSRNQNPKPSLDIETLDNGVQKSKTYYDFLMEEKQKWESYETE